MDRIERLLWKIDYKLGVLLEVAQPGLREKVRQEIVDILYDREETNDQP